MKKSSGKKKVLFVCVGNMIRSQMAEAFARAAGAEYVEPYSAGIAHTGLVSDRALLVMQEKGIDIHDHYSKGLEDVPLDEMDYIVNMSGYPMDSILSSPLGATIVTWVIKDPLGGGIDRFRQTRDEIESKVNELLREIWKQSK